MAEFRMPSLGADMTAATFVAWKIKPGDTVTRGQIVAEVDTDKGVIDVECFEAGVVARLVAEPGQKLPVGAVLAVIDGASDASLSPTAPSEPVPVIAPRTTSVAPLAPSRTPLPASTQRVKITPAARKRAAALNVDLTRLMGSGPEGAIELADVERAAIPVPSSPPTSATPPEDGRQRMRRAIAAAMSKSKREIPHYYLQTKLDVSPTLSWLEAENGRRSIAERLLPAVLLTKAVALALRDVPELNGFWIDGRRQLAERVHVGFAISMKGGGLIAPAIHDADLKTLDELMTILNDLIPRARAGRLRSSEMTDATVTLTNLGDLGVETVYGVIYPPQLAIIGLGKIMPQPWVENGAVGVRPVLVATLAADHRATDGRRGGQFLESLNRRLQQPELL